MEPAGNAPLMDPLDIPGGVLRPRQLLAEGMQTEAVVNALIEDAAQLPVPLQNQDAADAAVKGSAGRR